MTILIGADRDGTINNDRNFYLGKDPNWREQVEMLPGVIEGIQRFNAIPAAAFFIITNQPGVAVTTPELTPVTEERIAEVNDFIVRRLEQNGCHINGVFACPFADPAYVRKLETRGWSYDPDYVRENPADMKPNIGMLRKAARSLGKGLDEIDRVYMIGDRESDILTGLNAGGKGIWVPSFKAEEEGQRQKIEMLQREHPERVYLAEDFLDAARWIEQDILVVSD